MPYKKRRKKLHQKKIHRFHLESILIITFVVMVLVLVSFDIASNKKTPERIPTCGDGTFENTCSPMKPYFCNDGILVEKASLCGCNNFLTKSGDSCISDYYKKPGVVTLRYILNGQKNEIDFTVYEEANDYVSNISRVIYYIGKEIPSRADFKHKNINGEIQRAMILPLVKEIQNLVPDDKVEQARIAISLVQNIPYGFSEKIFSFEGGEINHSRYSYEVLYENQGICGEKSSLMAFLLKEIGYGVSIFYFADENHEAVGIKCPVEKSLYNSGYCFVETGGPAIITDNSIEFIGGVNLSSIPEIILISEGISLPENMYEYNDAKTLKDIREKRLLGYLKIWRYNSIKERYNLGEVYNLR